MPVLMLTALVAVVVAVFGQSVPSIAAAVIAVALLAYSQAASVTAAVRSTLRDLRRVLPGGRTVP